MLTWNVERQVAPGKFYREGACLEDDIKPESDETMANGSKLFEMDTSKMYLYDEENGTWGAWGNA